MDELVDRYRPIYDEDGQLVEGDEPFNYERFISAIRDMRHFAIALANFQSPRLSAIQVAPLPPSSQRTVSTDIFAEQGARNASVVDGEHQELAKNHDCKTAYGHASDSQSKIVSRPEVVEKVGAEIVGGGAGQEEEEIYRPPVVRDPVFEDEEG